MAQPAALRNVGGYTTPRQSRYCQPEPPARSTSRPVISPAYPAPMPSNRRRRPRHGVDTARDGSARLTCRGAAAGAPRRDRSQPARAVPRAGGRGAHVARTGPGGGAGGRVCRRPTSWSPARCGGRGRRREAFGVGVEVDERWIELDYGPLERQPVGSVAPAILERWRRDPRFAPPGVETLAALGKRVHAACDELVDAAASLSRASS